MPDASDLTGGTSRPAASRPARGTLRGVRLMLAISWRADATRSVLAALTASGQFVVLPLRALGLKIITDAAIAENGHRALVGAAVIVGASSAFRLLAWASLNVRMRLREHTQLYLDTHLMGLTAGIPGVEHHEHPEYLDSVERLRAERAYLANPFNPISWSVASVLQAVVVVVLLFGVSPLLALLPLLGLPAAAAAARAEQRGIVLADGQAEKYRVLRHLMELATEPEPAKEVRVYGLGEELVRRRTALFARLESERAHLAVRNVTSVAAWWVVFAAGYAAALGWAAAAAHAGSISLGAVVLVLTLGAQLNAQLADLAFNVGWFVRSLRAVRRLVWFGEYADGAHAAFGVPQPTAPPTVLTDGIHLEHVTFAYPASDRPVLRDVTLGLPRGTTVAVVGENGSGKTTLVKLLLRMYDPTAGRITVDGDDLREFPVEQWRLRCTAGFQDFFRFELVARDAVGVGDTSAPAAEGRLVDALARAAASDLLTRLPAGLDTQLGRQFDGTEPSIGQWQKLALGRAMLRDRPLLLVLDEPTASLDAPTEHALFERFASAANDVAAETGGVTVLVSHRFSTVRSADLIVVMERGAVVDVGTHDELMARGGLYAELFGVQSRAYRVHDATS